MTPTPKRVTHDEAESFVREATEHDEAPDFRDKLLAYVQQQREASAQRKADVAVVRRIVALTDDEAMQEDAFELAAALDRLGGE